MEIGKNALLVWLQEKRDKVDAANVKVLAGFIVVDNK